MIITYKVGPDFFLKGPDNGVVTGIPPNLTYTPNPGFIGIDTFQYSISVVGNPRDSEPSLVTVNVIPIVVESYAGDGMVITGGIFTDQDKTGDVLLETASFVQEWSTSLVSISGTGGENIFVGWQSTDVGMLLRAPSEIQTPLVFDGLQNNTVVSIGDLVINRIDSGYDTVGPLGIGTYALANNFSTTWSSRIPNVAVRTDVWTDVVVFFSEPQDFEAGDRFRFVVLGRLSHSDLLDTASSTYANDLFNSGIADGYFVFSGMINDDPMAVIRDGSITFIQDGLVTIGYQGDNVDRRYPRIVIEPVEPPEPPVTLPPGITEISVEQSSSAAGAPGTEYTFTFVTNNGLPPNGQICMQWPFGFDIEDVNGICSDTIDGTFTAVKMGQTLKILRSNNGDEIDGETVVDITLKNMTNGKVPGGYFVEMNTADVGGVLIDGPAENPDAIPITAGKPDANTSMVDLVPDMGILANGSDTTMVVIVVRDKCGNLVQGVDAEIASSVPSDIITQPMFATDANGETVGTVAATVAGAHTIEVTVECPPSGPSIVINDTPMVAFASSSPVDSGSTVEASPSSIEANGSDSSTITVTVVDGLMNPVEGAMVTLAATGVGVTIFQPGSPTNVAGQTTGTVTGIIAGVTNIEATIDGSLVLTDTVDVTLVAGAPSDSNSMVFVSPTSGVAADGVADTTVTVKIYDAFNNPVVGEQVALFSTGSNNTFTPQMGVTDSNGCFFSSFTTTTDEAKTVTVLSDTLGFLSDTAAVTFDPVAPMGPNDGMSMVVAMPTGGLDADGVASSLITVTVLDGGGSPVSGESVSLSATGGGTTFSPVSGSTNGSGIFTSNLTSVSAGSKIVSADLTGSIGVLTDTASVTFMLVGAENITSYQYSHGQTNNDGLPEFTGGGGIANENPTTYLNDITVDFVIADDDKIVIDFSEHTSIDLSGISISAAFMDGTFSVSVDGTGKILTVERNGDGTAFGPGLFFLDVLNAISGDPGDYQTSAEVTTNGDVNRAGPTPSSNSIIYSLLEIVPVLHIGGSDYPADQLTQAVPDACAFDHWHSPASYSICSTSFAGVPLQDPDPPGCGYGTKISTGLGVIIDMGTPDAVFGISEFNRRFPEHQKADFDAGTGPFSPCPDLLVSSGVNHTNFILGDFPITYNLTFSLPFMTIPNDADIVVTFVGGAGAQLSAGTVGSFPAGDGTTSSVRVGQTVTITRNGDGTPLGVGFYLFGIAVTNVTNPAAIGFFNITVDIKNSMGQSLLVAPTNFPYSF